MNDGEIHHLFTPKRFENCGIHVLIFEFCFQRRKKTSPKFQRETWFFEHTIYKTSRTKHANNYWFFF